MSSDCCTQPADWMTGREGERAEGGEGRRGAGGAWKGGGGGGGGGKGEDKARRERGERAEGTCEGGLAAGGLDDWLDLSGRRRVQGRGDDAR